MPTGSQPKITVGITTYNRPGLLQEAVQSVLRQTFVNFEVIISNDNPDVTVTFDSIGIERDPRVKIVNQRTNLGELPSMNFMLDIAEGDWFVWLGDDDLFHPEFFELAAKTIMEDSADLVGVYSNYISMRSPDAVFPARLKSTKGVRYGAPKFLMDYTSRKIRLVGCNGVMRRETLRRVGGIPQLGNSFSPYGDTLIPILLVEHGNLCWLDEALVFYRAHPGSLSHNTTDFSAYTSAEADFLDRLERVCASPSVDTRSERPTANMMKWFAQQEWTILSRSPSLGTFAAAKKFIDHQLGVNLRRLSLRHRLTHMLYASYWLQRAVVAKCLNIVRRRASLGATT